VQCSNHLKQIGISICNFQAHENYLPPTRQPCHHGTWANVLWPYLDQVNLASAWDPQLSYHFQPLSNIQTQVETYYCPTRRRPPQLSQSGDERGSVPHRPGALGDYAAVAGDGKFWDWPPKQANGSMIHAGPWDAAGMVNVNCSGTSPDIRYNGMTLSLTSASIRDGLSNTMFVGERHVPDGGFGEAAHLDTCIYNPDKLERTSRFAGPGYGLARSPKEVVAINFGSYHPGVCQFVFGDGSVHSLNVTIDPVTLGYLATRANGEPIPSEVVR
jgi:hypothetical protein